MSIYPTGTPTNADLYVALDNFSTTLSALIDNVQTTISLTSVIGLPTVGILTIDSEKVKYTGISGNDVTGCTRGFSSTSAASHANGATVMFNIVEEHHNVIKDEVIAVETDLRAVQAALNDADTPASTAADVKDRFDQVVSEIKRITGNINWYDTVAKNLTQLLPLSGGTMTGNLVLPAGSAASPSLTFGDSDTGIWSATPNTIRFSSSGSEAFSIESSGTYHSKHLLFNSGGTYNIGDTTYYPGRIFIGSGSATNPSYSFAGDTNSGFYSGGVDDVYISLGGTGRYEFQTGQFRVPDGTASVPSMSFSSDPNTGIYSYAANQMAFTADGTVRAYVTTSGLTLGTGTLNNNDGTAAAPSYTFSNDSNTGIYSYGPDSIGISCGGALSLLVTNSFLRNIAGTVSEPAYSFISDSDTGMYRAGANQLVFARGGAAMFEVGTTYNISYQDTIPGNPGTVNLGNSSYYWNDVSYKTITDRGCLPWCDNGVELADGSIVTDLEALCTIEKHPTEITIQGLPKLNYKTFPKKAYKPADKDGELLPRDENDLPIGGADGVEMTMMFGVMIGAFKELKAKNDALEARIATLEAK